MSEYDNNWEDEFESEETRGGNAMQELRKAYKASQKQNKDMAEKLADMQKQIRTRSVKDVLSSKGLPEKISAFIPETATTSEEVEAWVAEYGDIFGVQAQPASDSNAGQVQQVDPAIQALSRISATQQSGQPYSTDPDQMAARMAAAQSPEELNQILFGSKLGPMAS